MVPIGGLFWSLSGLRLVSLGHPWGVPLVSLRFPVDSLELHLWVFLGFPWVWVPGAWCLVWVPGTWCLVWVPGASFGCLVPGLGAWCLVWVPGWLVWLPGGFGPLVWSVGLGWAYVCVWGLVGCGGVDAGLVGVCGGVWVRPLTGSPHTSLQHTARGLASRMSIRGVGAGGGRSRVAVGTLAIGLALCPHTAVGHSLRLIGSDKRVRPTCHMRQSTNEVSLALARLFDHINTVSCGFMRKGVP